MKICTRCKLELYESAFALRSVKTGRLSPVCRACQSAASQAHYRANKDRYYKRNDAAEEAIAELVRIAKSVPCTDCGVSYPPKVMDFHHRDPSTKLFDMATWRKLGNAKKKILAEIDKCDILCANCHRMRH